VKTPKCINEFAAVKTENDYVLCAEYDNGSVTITYERHRISSDKIEVIQHRNRDKNGNYYTTRKIINSNIISL
jgi:hypothetical protein